MKQIQWIDTTVYGAVTLKDQSAPEQNNMALHVCQDPKAVLKNRIALCETTGIPLKNWALSWQKHTANRAEVKREHKGRGATKKETSLMDVDALFTHEPNVLIGVFTADCVGILLCDEQTPCVCAIHSGWKGTAQAITYHTVKALAENGDLVPARTKAFFSPSIFFDSREVGKEVVEPIEAMGREIDLDVEPFIRRVNGGKAYIDNQGLNIEMLRRLGVRDIVPTGLDTKKEPADCFSYRNDKQCGEHFTYGFIKKEEN